MVVRVVVLEGIVSAAHTQNTTLNDYDTNRIKHEHEVKKYLNIPKIRQTFQSGNELYAHNKQLRPALVHLPRTSILRQ